MYHRAVLKFFFINLSLKDGVDIKYGTTFYNSSKNNNNKIKYQIILNF